MKIIWNIIFLLLLLVRIPAPALGQPLKDISNSPQNTSAAGLKVPPFQDRVMDLAQVLEADEIATLKGKLAFLQLATTTSIGVLIIPDLQGEVLEEYSLKVANTWKLGRCDINNGVLILVAMKDRALRIEVGLGLESFLTNEACKRIIEEDMIPFFKAGDVYSGLDSGIRAITEILTSSKQYRDILISSGEPKCP